MARFELFLMLILSSLCSSNTYKILTIFPYPSKGGSIRGDGIVKHLSEAGHEITYITTSIPEKTHPNVTVIVVSDNVKLVDGDVNVKYFMNKQRHDRSADDITDFMKISNNTVANANVQRLMSDKEQYFDVVIAEYMFNEAFAGFAGVFNCPYIWFSTFVPHWQIMRLIDYMPYKINPRFNSSIFRTVLQRANDVSKRIEDTFIRIFHITGLKQMNKRHTFNNDIYESLFIPHIRNKGLLVPSFETLKFNASLVLGNSYVPKGEVSLLPSNFISIVGYHIDTTVKPLPKDLQEIMDNAKYGVIYFSMGSILKSKDFPNEIKQGLMKIFGKLKQIVLWNIEEDLPDRPKNVHILKWAPQQSILAHRNCNLFITHGGLLSTIESIHFGVPIIGIPAFADQFINVDKAVMEGYAMKVDLSNKIVEDLEIAIQEVLSDSKYTSKVKELSQAYHNRTALPSEMLVKWVEHVVATGGVPHLRSPAFLLPWYQKLYLEELFLISLCIINIIYTIRRVIMYICGSKKTTSNKIKVN